MAYSAIDVVIEDRALIISLNRPAKHNALSLELGKDLLSALGKAESDQAVRGIVITGSDKAFSTGVDLNEALLADTPEKYRHFNFAWRSVTSAIERSPKPVIAAIGGYCITGGLEMAMACDFRIAAAGSQFAMTSAKVGSVAGSGGTQRLPRLVGPANAMDMIFTARFVSADEALRIGLVNQVVPDGTVVAAARGLVQQFVRQSPQSIAWAKEAIRTGLKVDLESGLDLEAAFSGMAFASADKAEGMRAFLDKREPIFRGA